MSYNSEKPGYSSPLRLLAIIAGSIFAAEAVIMAILYFVRPFTAEWAKALLDSTLLIIILSPVFYYFLFRPLILHIHERRQAEEALEKARDELEERVSERTRELKNANEKLQKSNALLELHSLELATAKETLNKENTFISAVLDTVGAIIVVLDTAGRIVRFNRAGEQITGYASAEVKGGVLWDLLMPPEEQDEVKAVFEDLKSGHFPIYHENNWVGKNGKQALIAWSNTVLMDAAGQAEYIIGTGLDITERKKIEKMKDEFISTVSHELRTPLTSIHGALGLINSGVTGEFSAQAKTMLDIAHKNSQRLIHLINDILDIEKIESGRMEFRMKPLKLSRIIEQALEANTAYGEQFGIRFAFENTLPEAEVYADSNRLMQLMTNLLSNAAKFSQAGDVVSVSMLRHNNSIRVSVLDHGPGIPEEFHNKIFQRFAQADASDSRQKGGTGLGLSISKAIVERHNGQIGFNTKAGAGTTLYFDLPEWKEADLVSEAETDLPSRPLILVCEDDPDVATLLRLMLRQGGFNVDIAYNAEQARRMLSEKSYNAMTLDLLLPDKNGIALLKELRENEKTADFPVIVVSAIAQQAHAMLNGGALSVIDWIDKPIEQERLIAAVRMSVFKTKFMPRILHVEDDPDIFRVVSTLLKDVAVTVCAPTFHEAVQKIRQESFDLIILDIGLPDQSGINLFQHLEGMYIPVIIFSVYDISEEVLEKVSAALLKSRTSNEQLRDTILSVLHHNKMYLQREMAE